MQEIIRVVEDTKSIANFLQKVEEEGVQETQAQFILRKLLQKGLEPISLNDPAIEDVQSFLSLGDEAVLGYFSFTQEYEEALEKIAQVFGQDLQGAKGVTMAYNFNKENGDIMTLFLPLSTYTFLEKYLEKIEHILFGFKYCPDLEYEEIVLLIIK